MTPLTLELSGFTCFKERMRIDFSELSLFAISGPTGSGKSTLLDAMTYALYGQIARLGSKGLDLISPGLTQMSVQFAFENHHGIYRVTRTLERKKTRNEAQTRIEKLDTETWKQLPESEKIKEANARLEQLVGLDYEGFTRAILLPQGAFDEFLRGDPSQRRQLLVNLLNLDKVQRMQQEAGQRARQAEIQRDAIESRLNQEYAGATLERKRELLETLEQLTQQQTHLSQKLEHLDSELKRLEALKLLFEEQQKIQQTLAELKAREPEITRAHLRLEQGKRVLFLLPMLRQRETLMTRMKTLESTLQAKTSSLETLKVSLETSRETLQGLEQKTQERLPQIEAHLARLAAFTPLLEQLRLRGGSLALASEASGLVYTEAAWEAMQQALSQLPHLQQAEANWVSLEKETAESLEKHELLLKTLQGLEKQLVLLTEKGKQARNVFEEARAIYEQAVLRNQAALLRAHLHSGDTCPVCSQIITVLPADQSSNLSLLKQQCDDLEKQVADLQSQYTEVRANLRSQKQRFSEQQEHLEGLRTRCEAARHLLEKQVRANTDFGTTPKEITEGLQAHRRALLASLAATIQAQTGGVDVAQTQKALQQEKRGLSEQLKSAEVQFRQAERDVDKVQTERMSLQSQLEQGLQEQQELSDTLQDALTRAGFISIEAAKQATLSENELKQLEVLINSFTVQKENVVRREVELQARLSGQTFDEQRWLSYSQETSQTRLVLDDVKDTLGRTRQQLSDIDLMLTRASQLRQESEALARHYDIYDQLSKDLRGNKFQDYLLNQLQGRLALRASHMMREVTEGRYELQLLENEYQVYDAWTQETRSVRTLSGGETFIASLALALALSDLLAGNKALGALFLDEGFGTLDAETLDLVANVLESLSHQGRMVGVITHVQALSARLPARLTVTKSASGSSISWDF